MDDYTPPTLLDFDNLLPKIAVGLVLLTMGVLVVLAILSFIGTPLDDRPADVIKAAADAAAGEGA